MAGERPRRSDKLTVLPPYLNDLERDRPYRSENEVIRANGEDSDAVAGCLVHLGEEGACQREPAPEIFCKI